MMDTECRAHQQHTECQYTQNGRCVNTKHGGWHILWSPQISNVARYSECIEGSIHKKMRLSIFHPDSGRVTNVLDESLQSITC